jgi:hypothetical protein
MIREAQKLTEPDPVHCFLLLAVQSGACFKIYVSPRLDVFMRIIFIISLFNSRK